ncbi:putative negative regulator of RcsB-dependent stress response [Nocardioides cavernae]|nr:putative negative regulator of RcsB-dependent stress response [Nocardioides cavernae]
MITSTGVYLIVALVLLVIVGGGIVVGYRKYRHDQ